MDVQNRFSTYKYNMDNTDGCKGKYGIYEHNFLNVIHVKYKNNHGCANIDFIVQNSYEEK